MIAGEIDQALIAVWRQVLVEHRPAVRLGNRRYAVGRIPTKGLSTIDFEVGPFRFFGIEQNPDTRSRWAALARNGHRVMQFRHRGYVANVCDGKIFRYPAWNASGLPHADPKRTPRSVSDNRAARHDRAPSSPRASRTARRPMRAADRRP